VAWTCVSATSAYVCGYLVCGYLRQHTYADTSILTVVWTCVSATLSATDSRVPSGKYSLPPQHTSAYVSIRQHTSATDRRVTSSKYSLPPQHASAYVSIRLAASPAATTTCRRTFALVSAYLRSHKTRALKKTVKEQGRAFSSFFF